RMNIAKDVDYPRLVQNHGPRGLVAPSGCKRKRIGGVPRGKHIVLYHVLIGKDQLGPPPDHRDIWRESLVLLTYFHMPLHRSARDILHVHVGLPCRTPDDDLSLQRSCGWRSSRPLTISARGALGRIRQGGRGNNGRWQFSGV